MNNKPLIKMIICKFKTSRIETPAMGIIHTRYDKYIHGCDNPTDTSGDAATLPNFRRVLLRDCKSIESHSNDLDPDLDTDLDTDFSTTECFIHNSLYIKQVNLRLLMGDYRKTMSSRECQEFILITSSLSGYAPFMDCLRCFIHKIGHDETMSAILSGACNWKSLWLSQMYTPSVPSNEQVLHHCILRSVNTVKNGHALIGMWFQHKATWIEKRAGDVVSSIMHHAGYEDGMGVKQTRPFFISLTPLREGIENDAHLLLDADSTHLHRLRSKISSKLDEMYIIARTRPGERKEWLITKYELRLEVRFNLPFGYHVVEFSDSEDVLKAKLKRAPLVACRYVNGEWFIGEVVKLTDTRKCEYTILYASYLPESVSETTYKAQLTLANYNKDWIFVEKDRQGL